MGRRSDVAGAALDKASDQVASPVSGRLLNRGPSSSLTRGRLQTGRTLEPLSISAAHRSCGLAAARYSWLPGAAAGHCSPGYVPVASEPDFVGAGLDCNAFMTLNGLDGLAAWSVGKDALFGQAEEEDHGHRKIMAVVVEAGRGGKVQILEEATASNRAGGNRGKLPLARSLIAHSCCSQQERGRQGPLKCRRPTPLDGKIWSKRVGNRAMYSACGVAARRQGSSEVQTDPDLVKFSRGAAQIEAIVSLRTRRRPTRSVVDELGRSRRWQRLSICLRLGKESITLQVQELKAPSKCSVAHILPPAAAMKKGNSYAVKLNEEEHGAIVPYPGGVSSSDWMYSKEASWSWETSGCTNRSWGPAAETYDKCAPQLVQVVQSCTQPLLFLVERQRLVGQEVETLFLLHLCSLPHSLLPPGPPGKSVPWPPVVEVLGRLIMQGAQTFVLLPNDDQVVNAVEQAGTGIGSTMEADFFLSTALCDDNPEAPSAEGMVSVEPSASCVDGCETEQLVASSSLSVDGVQSEGSQVQTEMDMGYEMDMGHDIDMNGWVIRVAVACVRRRWRPRPRRDEMEVRECPSSPNRSRDDEAGVRLVGGGQWELDEVGVAAKTLGSRMPSGAKGILGSCIVGSLLASSLVYLVVSSGNRKLLFSSTSGGQRRSKTRTTKRTQTAAALSWLCVRSVAAIVLSSDSSRKAQPRGGGRGKLMAAAVAAAAAEAIRPYRRILHFLEPMLSRSAWCKQPWWPVAAAAADA